MKKESTVRNKTLADLKKKAQKDFGMGIAFSNHSAFPYQHLDGIEFSYTRQGQTVRVNGWQSGENVIFQQTVLVGSR